MSGVKHTPGPWMEIETESSVDHEWADGGLIGGWQDIGPEEGEAVAVVLFRNRSDHSDADARGEANARLIAAAPDHHAVALELDRLALVIDSAIRFADPAFKDEVQALLRANKSAITRATGDRPEKGGAL